jgi:hypothetical protein
VSAPLGVTGSTGRLGGRRVNTCRAIASGELSGVSGDVLRLTGRAPRSLADLLAG